MNKAFPLDLLRANSETMAGKLKILSHPERLLMLCRMADDEVTVGELVELTGMSQSAVSQHLARFRDMGLVNVRPVAQARYYSLTDNDIKEIIRALWEICEANGAGERAPPS